MKTMITTILAALALAAAPPAAADATAWIQDDDNTAVMQEFVDAVNVVVTKYGLAPITVYTQWFDSPDIYASAEGGVITVNKRWTTAPPQELTSAVAEDIAAGFHNPGCGPIETIAVHESAHIIDQRRGYLPRYRAMRAAGLTIGGASTATLPELTGYSFDESGYLNPGEALAEAFQAVVCGSADATEYQLYEMLVK